MKDFDLTFETEYFVVKFIFNGRRYFIIRYVDHETGLMDIDGRPLIFRNLHNLLCCADDAEIELSAEEPESHNIDTLADWADSESAVFSHDEVIRFWSISDDFARALDAAFSGDMNNRKTEALYEKLFWGCDFPGVKLNAGEEAPSWSQNEIQMIKSIVREGIAIITPCLQASRPQEESQ